MSRSSPFGDCGDSFPPIRQRAHMNIDAAVGTNITLTPDVSTQQNMATGQSWLVHHANLPSRTYNFKTGPSVWARRAAWTCAPAHSLAPRPGVRRAAREGSTMQDATSALEEQRTWDLSAHRPGPHRGRQEALSPTTVHDDLQRVLGSSAPTAAH